MGGLGDFAVRCGFNLQTESVDPLAYAITQARNTSAIIAACFAWVLVTVLDSLAREEEPSLPALPWPCQTSVTYLYSVMAITARAKCGRVDLNSKTLKNPSSATPLGSLDSRAVSSPTGIRAPQRVSGPRPLVRGRRRDRVPPMRRRRGSDGSRRKWQFTSPVRACTFTEKR